MALNKSVCKERSVILKFSLLKQQDKSKSNKLLKIPSITLQMPTKQMTICRLLSNSYP